MNKQSIRERLRTIYTDADLRAWFDPLHLRFSESGNIEVVFPHALFARWFGRERRKTFEREVAQFFGASHRVSYAKPDMGKASHGKALRKSFREHAVTVARQSSESAQWSFDSFIFNKKNEFPVSMAREIAMSAENPAYTPFIICGTGCCGKTHLLRAMAADIAKTFGNGGIFLGTAEELQAMAVENDKPGVFKRKLVRYKAICLDNAQEIARYTELQQELIHVVDVFREKNKPFVMALDESFDLSALNEKLRSRFASGLVVTVKKPDLDVRLRYARIQCAANRLHLKKELLLPLAQRFDTFPAIQGVVAKVAAYQNKTDKPITLGDLEKIMANNALAGNPATAKAIIARVADVFSLPESDITGPGREADVVFARQVAMYLCRELLGAPYSALGRYFGGKNHSTVLHACKKIENSMKSNQDMHNTVTQIRKKFLSRTA